MATPPILDIFVVWHPEDGAAAARFEEIHRHFHGVAFSGLAGGAVEVYARSEGWLIAGGAPRALGIEGGLAPELPPAQFNVIVPVVDVELARAVGEAGGEWEAYFTEIARIAQRPEVLVVPFDSDGAGVAGSSLEPFIGSHQALDRAANASASLLGRELSQAIAQWVDAARGGSGRLKLFLSHTKQEAAGERGAYGPKSLVKAVRERILGTHLADFFDAQDIQAGSNWAETLRAEAAGAALLMVRTDLYAGREWTQAEVLTAKVNAMPVVGMYALRDGEERGSFLLDHVPTVTCDVREPIAGIDSALDRLADEALKNVLWKSQSSYLEDDGFDWRPANSPEPATLIPWLAEHQAEQPEDGHIWVIHPDPPLQTPELGTLEQLCRLAGYRGDVDILTPRTFAQRGGVMRAGQDPDVVALGALDGAKVALSASESADLGRLGLTEYHCRLVVAEVGRAIMLAGGVVVYGGDLREDGYTQILIDQAQRFSRRAFALELVLPESVYREVDVSQLEELNRELGEAGRLTLVSAAGQVVRRGEVSPGFTGDVAGSLSAVRSYVATNTTSRVVVGGRLEGYAGAEPGIVEEARLTVEAGRPLLAAAGFGGASAAIAFQMTPETTDGWVPGPDFPRGAEGAAVAVERFRAAFEASGVNATHSLGATHRPGDIATSVVTILADALTAS